jgi:GAF domain-containing protein
MDEDLEQLRRTAIGQENRWDFRLAKASWRKLHEYLPDDSEAKTALQRIEAYQQLEQERLVMIDRLLSIGLTLTDSKSLLELMELMLAASREVTCSDAGSIYIIDRFDPQNAVVRFLVAQNDSQPDRTLSEFAVPLNNQSLVGYVAMTGECLNLADAQAIPATAPYRHHHSFDEDINYQTKSVVVVPIQTNQGQIIGVVQLINRKINPHDRIVGDAQGLVQSYSDWEVGVVKSLAGKAALLIERNRFLP